MTREFKKSLSNHGLKLSEQVAVERLRRAGVTIGADMKLGRPATTRKDRLPLELIRRLAGD
jgi:hypothetical protein